MQLSICIPTYNRASELNFQLESLKAQLLKMHDAYLAMLEVLVIDNCSSDSTEAVSRKFFSNFPVQFSYYKNSINLGFDYSILKLYTIANGRYVWFLSDDDKIVENKIEYILNILITNHPDLCYANIGIGEKSARAAQGLVTSLTHFPRRNCFVQLKTNQMVYFKNNLEKLAYIRLCSFISSCIILKNSRIIPELHQFIGTGLMQDAIMNLALGIGSSVYLPEEIIIVSGEKEYVSAWFMHSVLFGNRTLYCSNLLKKHETLNRIVSLDSCRFGLMILANRKSKEVRYSVTIHLFIKIFMEYKLQSIFMLKELFFAIFPNIFEIRKKVIKIWNI